MKNFILLTTLLIGFYSCSFKNVQNTTPIELRTNTNEDGQLVKISVFTGKEYHHPTFSVWVESIDGQYIETLYVSQYLASGVYGHGALGENKWDSKPGPANRPATLPYWLHKRSIAEKQPLMPDATHPVPDGITGATPKNDFVLASKITKELPSKFKVLFEINNPWDYNSYWKNDLYPNDFNYKTSAQPAVVYAVEINRSELDQTYYLNPIGHSHYSGSDGKLYTNLSTLTTSLKMVNSVAVSFK